MTYLKPWHRDYGDPEYQAPPECPDSYIEDYLKDTTFKLTWDGVTWLAEATWGTHLTTDCERDTAESAIAQAIENVKKLAVERWYDREGWVE